MENQEQIIRKVTEIGNGAHVFAPKEWLGENVFVIKPSKKSLKEKILAVIEPYLEHIEGVYLYGSHARNEETEDSDIDLLLITTKKLKIKKQGYEIISLEKRNMQNAIKTAPILIYSVLSEAIPIINASLLEELKTLYEPKLQDFKEFVESTNKIIAINEQFLKEDVEDKIKEETESIPYSLTLRLRGLFIINSLLSKKAHSNKDFKIWVNKKVPDIDFNSVYQAYRMAKSNKKSKVKVKDLFPLIPLLKKETDLLENKIYGEKKKTP